jgi:hypothetical protein
LHRIAPNRPAHGDRLSGWLPMLAHGGDQYAESLTERLAARLVG